MPARPQPHSLPKGYPATLGGRQLVVPYAYPPRCQSYQVEQLACRRPNPQVLELRLKPALRVYFALAHGLGGVLLGGMSALIVVGLVWWEGPALHADRLLAFLVGGCVFLAAGAWQLFAALHYAGDWGRVTVDLAASTIKCHYRPWAGFQLQRPLSRVLAVDLVEYQAGGLPVLPFTVNPDDRRSQWVVSLILNGDELSSQGLTWSADREEAQAAGRQLATALRVPFLDALSIRGLTQSPEGGGGQ